MNPNRQQNRFVWRINTWISNKWRWKVFKNLECSFESFWCLQEKLYHRRRQFNWLGKTFQNWNTRHLFWIFLILVHKIFFFFKKLPQSIFHLVIVFSLILSWKVVAAWSKVLQHSSEQRVRHCGKLCKYLKIWEVPLLIKCSRTRVDKCRGVSPT